MDLYNYKKCSHTKGGPKARSEKGSPTSSWKPPGTRDLQSKRCYIYDYFHDDQKSKNKGMTYSPETTKTPVDLKFIITQYGSLSKDQIEYHVQFKPSWRFEEPSYMKEYETKFQAEIPIGAYVDIPDDQGIYHKWLICSKEIGNQFIKYSVLPCNYYFHWVCGGKKYDMWGVARLRS